MPDHSLTLTPPTLREGPYVEASQACNSNENWYVTPGSDSDGVPQLYVIENIFVNVACCATVGNRNLRIRIYNTITGSYSWMYIRTSNITASQVLAGQVGPVQLLDGLAGYYGDYYWGVSKDGLVLNGDNILHIFLNGGVTGDVTSCYVKFRYQNRELGMPTPYNRGGPWPQ